MVIYNNNKSQQNGVYRVALMIVILLHKTAIQRLITLLLDYIV